MKKLILLALLPLVITACVSKSELDHAQQENSNLRSQIEQLKQQITELQSKLHEANAKLSAATSALEKKPPMPVKISFRRALLGPGYVAVLNTTIKQDFPVLVTVHSKALGTNQQFTVNLSQTAASAIGHSQGAAIEPGDEITVMNNNYEPITVVLSLK